jgi:phosphatidylserine synthase
MIPAANAMIDVVTLRESSLKSKVQVEILLLFFVISLICSFLSEFEMKMTKLVNKVTHVSFALLTSLVIYVILNLADIYQD